MEEDEPLELTLDERKAHHGQNKRQAASNIYQSGVRKDNIKLSQGRKHHKKHENDHIPDTLRRRRRGGIGGRERGGNRVPNENINGPDNKAPEQPVPCVDDEEDFPTTVNDGTEQGLHEATKQRCDESVKKSTPTRGTKQAWRPNAAPIETRSNRDDTEQHLQKASKQSLGKSSRCIESTQGNVSVLTDITSLYELSEKIFLSDKMNEQKQRGRLWMSNNLEEPPDDFCDLPILPTKMDLQEDVAPFIRCVRFEGGYKDVHEYLDVQFRLMRQDFIIPLREGIGEFKKNHCTKDFKSSHLRFYFNVRITGTIFDNGINHVLRVDDTKLHNFQWEQSNCLMYGSLLCLSKDNFETVIFATVADDITKLDKGFIVVSFQTGLDDVFNSTSNDVYVMAETTAFFESYCHVLEGLQEMVTKLPLQDYIVHCKTELKPPQYLFRSGRVRGVPKYDLSCLMENEITCKVPVLTTVKWPKAEVMCLNESQREAAQLALTKELAIIQGPPGTGKTYVGLKVMQVLLENKHIMAQSDEKNNDPILVVCYTNHALDQFLEGVLKFCPDGIVRVGGQSKSDKLHKFNLGKLRDILNIENRAKGLYEISDKINKLNEIKESLQTDIITEHTLKSQIGNGHLNSLLYERVKFNNDDARIHEWLTTSKQTTQSVLSQMIKAHLTMLVLKTKVNSKPSRFSPDMNIIQRANFYCFFLELYESKHTCDVYWLLTQPLTQVNIYRMTKILYWLKTARTQILPDHQIGMMLYEGDWEAIYKYSKPAFGHVGDSSDSVIENWLLMPNQSLHLQLDDVQMLTGITSHKDDDDGGALGPDYMFLKEQNDRMVDVDRSYSNKVRARVKTAVNSLLSVAKRAEALGIRDDVLMEHDVDSNEWKAVTKSKLNLRAVHRKLQFIKPMTCKEEDNVKSVWDLELDKRFALYNLWVQRYKLEICWQLQELCLKYISEHEKQTNAENMETLQLLQAAKVIGITTSGAAKHRAALQDVGCRIIVVEDAAEVLESHILTFLNKNCKHLILIGDHQHLRPKPTVYRLAKDFGLEMSLFERLIKNKVPHVMLKEQYRMRPEISQIMRHIYPDLQDHPSVSNFEKIRGLSKNVFFIQHEHEETHLDESMSKANTHEAKFLVALCQYLLNQDYEASQITILATYSGQVFEIRKTMRDQKLDPTVLVTALDNYQGEENDIILLSLVRSNTENGVGILKVDNRVCVALSRARKGLYVIGNLDLLASQSKLWNKIVKTARSEEIIGSSLCVNCQNHPDFREFMISDQDFLKCPEGGCGRPCKSKLKCGHICDKLCHGYDLDHTKYKCLEPCPKSCDNGHPCKQKCYEECMCPVLVLRQIPFCGHEGEFPCHEPAEHAVCSLHCCSILDCGHQCFIMGGQCIEKGKHNVCTVQVEYKWPCGHTENVPCHTATPYNGNRCKHVCGEELHCGHKCVGVCGECKSKEKHIECTVQVQHQWSYGHYENVPCHTTKSKDACKQIWGTKRVYENIKKMRRIKRAAEKKQRLERKTAITEKQKADLQASQRELDFSPIRVAQLPFIDIKNIANLVELRAHSFNMKCAFVLNTTVSVMKNPANPTSIEFLRSRWKDLFSFGWMLTNQQREECITELSRCFWLHCLSHLDCFTIPVHLKQPQDFEIDEELKMIIQALDEQNVTKHTLTSAQFWFDRKNKRIRETSQIEEDRKKSLFLQQTSLKVRKTLTSSDDDMLYHLIKRNFQDVPPKPSISDRPDEATVLQ